MVSLRSPKTGLTVVLIAAAFLYVLRWPFYYAGMINDDAVYIILAQALGQGQYAALHYPGHPPFTLYPPGFPLVLAPFIAFVKPHWALLRIIPFILTLLNSVLIWDLSRGWLPESMSLLSTALFAFNPVTVAWSTAVMSEPLFIASILLSFFWMRRLLEHRDDPLSPWVLGLLLGYVVLVRTVGILFVSSVVAGLVLTKRWKTVFHVGGLALLVGGSFAVRNYLVAHQWTAYSSAWETGFRDAHSRVEMVHLMNRIADRMFVTSIFANEISSTPLASIFRILLRVVGGMAVCSGGLFLWRRSSIIQRPLVISCALFLGLWPFIYLLWNSDVERYFWPILPFLLILFVAGLHGPQKRWPNTCMLAGILLLVAYVCGNVKLWASIKPAEPPKATWAWIRTNLPPDARLVNPKAGEVYLYTSRQALGMLGARDRDRYRYLLLKQGVTHILLQSFRMSDAGQANNFWLLNQAWTISWPEAFRLVYQNTKENCAVYQVIPDPAYQEAYLLFEQACMDLSSSRLRQGFKKLDQAQRLSPPFVSALNAYGSSLLLFNGNLSLAIKMLTQAVAAEPGNALAWLDLGRAYHRVQKNESALRAFRNSDADTYPPTSYEDLRPIIENEIDVLLKEGI